MEGGSTPGSERCGLEAGELPCCCLLQPVLLQHRLRSPDRSRRLKRAQDIRNRSVSQPPASKSCWGKCGVGSAATPSAFDAVQTPRKTEKNTALPQFLYSDRRTKGLFTEMQRRFVRMAFAFPPCNNSSPSPKDWAQLHVGTDKRGHSDGDVLRSAAWAGADKELLKKLTEKPAPELPPPPRKDFTNRAALPSPHEG